MDVECKGQKYCEKKKKKVELGQEGMKKGQTVRAMIMEKKEEDRRSKWKRENL